MSAPERHWVELPLCTEALSVDLERDVIFSLLDEFVWASWPGESASVELGPCSAVTEAMRDFLAQCELGERLADHPPTNH